MTHQDRREKLLNAATALWIGVTSTIFFLCFSIAFYADNEEAIRQALRAFFGRLGI